MKKFMFLLFILITGVAAAETINITWYNEDSTTYDTTTCNVGDTLVLPTAPTKRGYTFLGWSAYIPLEYIESTGTQYIDNIIKPNKDYSFEIKYKHTVSTGYQTLFAVYDGITGYSYGFMAGSASKGNYAYSGNSKTFTLAYDTNTIYTLYYDGVNKKVYRNGTEIVNFSDLPGFSGTTGVAPRLFQMISGEHYSGSFNYPFKGYAYGFKVYDDNNIIVRDLVPVKRNSDNAIGMYDIVSGQFFTNAGTGDFIAGPVIE